MLHIESLEIDDHILDKIEYEHGVRFKEVEEVLRSKTHHVRRSRQGYYSVFGQTEAGRYIMVGLVYKGESNWKIATAMEMNANTKRRYKRVRGDN